MTARQNRARVARGYRFDRIAGPKSGRFRRLSHRISSDWPHSAAKRPCCFVMVRVVFQRKGGLYFLYSRQALLEVFFALYGRGTWNN